jgi:hypothetical protein
MIYLSLFEIFAGLAQLVEQLICNQQVGGSIPLASFYLGQLPKWSKGADCKSAAHASEVRILHCPFSFYFMRA